MFDLGFPPETQMTIADLFNESHYAQYLVSYRPPHRVQMEYGYRVQFLYQMPTYMHGSAEAHTAYFYSKIGPVDKLLDAPNLFIPGRENYAEESIAVYCDPMFLAPARFGVSSVSTQTAIVAREVEAFMRSPRGNRHHST